MQADVTANRRAHSVALRLALVYSAAAATWIVVSDQAAAMLDLPADITEVIDTSKGILFVAVTAVVLYVISSRYLSASYHDEERYRQAQEALHDREQSIRQAYIDVLDAVTGGRLILMWPDALLASLGEVVTPATPILRPADLGEARHGLAEVLGRFTDRVDEQVLAANEGLTNVLKHGDHGEYGVRRTPHCVQVVISDFGPGIDFHTLPKATLLPGFSTKPSLGMGFTIMLEVAERLLLATEPGLTTLVLEFDLLHEPTASEAEPSA